MRGLFGGLLLAVGTVLFGLTAALDPPRAQGLAGDDYSELPYAEAFASLHGRISREYAFTE